MLKIEEKNNGKLTVVAGRCYSGKTSEAIRRGAEVLANGGSVFFVTIEQTSENVLAKFTDRVSDCGNLKILRLDFEDCVSLKQIKESYVDDNNNFDLIIIDNFDLISSVSEKMVYRNLDKIIDFVGEWAEEINTNVLITVSLSRNGE